jgi:hypothetical protein
MLHQDLNQFNKGRIVSIIDLRLLSRRLGFGTNKCLPPYLEFNKVMDI